MKKISAAIITKNEESQIEECIKSIVWADEIVILDSGSTDKTIEIAEKFTDKIYYKKWEGFAPQKKHALTLVNNEWVLSLDADERITEELKNEIMQVDLNEFDGYVIPRDNYFLGKCITTCGWGRDSQLRFFKNTKTSVTDRLVHEGFVVNGKIGLLKNPIIHYTYNSIESAISKINHYSSLQTMEVYKSKGRVSGFTIIAHGAASFYKSFIALKGFKDGIHGLCIAIIDSLTTFLTYMKIWELQLQNKRNK
jgi:glycosyltransferase involved in cell wall biosynthesis